MGSVEDVIKAAEEIQSIKLNTLRELRQLNAKVDFIYEETKKSKYGYIVNIFLGIGFACVGASVGYAVAEGKATGTMSMAFLLFALMAFVLAVTIQRRYFSITEVLEELSEHENNI